MLGVAQYLRETQPWSVDFNERRANDGPPLWLASWKGDGIISRIVSPQMREIVREKKIPVVDLNEQLGGMGIPQITNDHAAVGRMAADHLLKRGFQRFAFLGFSGHRWSDVRGRAFAEAVEAEGYSCDMYVDELLNVEAMTDGSWHTELDSIVSWVSSLEKPIGILACSDFRGVQLLNACRLAGVAVPEQVALVSVGADDVACQFADPPMSSVMFNGWKMGYEAAALLDGMMRGEAPAQAEILIPPLDVVVRRSSDIRAISDPLVAKAVNFIQENARSGMNVEAVLRRLNVSRSTLQNRFRAALNQSVHDVLIEARLAAVKELLTETRLPIAEISARCGFQYPEYMSAALKKHTGYSPAHYRRQHGGMHKLDMLWRMGEMPAEKRVL